MCSLGFCTLLTRRRIRSPSSWRVRNTSRLWRTMISIPSRLDITTTCQNAAWADPNQVLREEFEWLETIILHTIPKTFPHRTLHAYPSHYRTSCYTFSDRVWMNSKLPSAHIDTGQSIWYGLIDYLDLCFSDCIDSHRVLGHQVDERFFFQFRWLYIRSGYTEFDSASGGSIRRKSSALVYAACLALGDIDFSLF